MSQMTETLPLPARVKVVAWSKNESELRTIDGKSQVCGPANTDVAERLAALWNDALPHPDAEGHLADAVRDICLEVFGRVVTFDQSRVVAKALINKMQKLGVA